MKIARLEAISDGVFAIILTIMVLEMKVPHGAGWSDILPIWPLFLSYFLSFTTVAVFWNNHAYLLHTVSRLSSPILWSNFLLLFFLSLIPFTTGWMGENDFEQVPVFIYSFNLFLCAISYVVMVRCIRQTHGGLDSLVGRAVGNDLKGLMSVISYFGAMVISFFAPLVSLALLFFLAAIWFVPDRRIARLLDQDEPPKH